MTKDEAEVARRRLHATAQRDDALDRLEEMPAPRIATWMRRRARLADGLAPWAPIVGTAALLAAVAQARARLGELVVHVTRKRRSAWPLLTAGLLHDVAGHGCEEAARTMCCASSTAGRYLGLHRSLLRADREYARVTGEIMRAALDATYPLGPPA
jgi:hypothetical protein